jgi:hypothetical protein
LGFFMAVASLDCVLEGDLRGRGDFMTFLVFR